MPAVGNYGGKVLDCGSRSSALFCFEGVYKGCGAMEAMLRTAHEKLGRAQKKDEDFGEEVSDAEPVSTDPGT